MSDNYRLELNKKLNEVKLVQVKFGINFTEDELQSICFEPHSKLAIKTKQYVYQCVKEAARRYLEAEQIMFPEEECNN